MPDPSICLHPQADVVLVDDGVSECTRCGLQALVMPCPGPRARATIADKDRAIAHIRDIRASLAAKRRPA